jgi:hypothetical protein
MVMTNVMPPTQAPLPPSTTPSGGSGIGFRGANVLLGLWLIVSAFLWVHTRASQTNTWLVGLTVAAVAMIAMSVPRVRLLNTITSAWLFVSSVWLFEAASGAIWNNVVVAIAVFVLSLLPSVSVARNRIV